MAILDTKARFYRDPKATPEEIKTWEEISSYWANAMRDATKLWPNNPYENYWALTILAAEGGRLSDAITTQNKEIQAPYLTFVYNDIYSMPSEVESDDGKAHVKALSRAIDLRFAEKIRRARDASS